MKYTILVNRDSGNCAKLNIDALKERFGSDSEVRYVNDACSPLVDGDGVVVCGGDGTLKNALDDYPDKQIFFVPCGTLNETKHFGSVMESVGECNGTRFSYVCATGSFTEIGYRTKCTDKQRSKRLAYILQAFKWYKCHDFTAQIDIDGKRFDGNYTLLMVIKNSTCFGLPFNKMYDKKPQTYMLGINACGKNNLLNKIKMFFPFFRVFFCGVRRPTVNPRWFLLPFDNAEVTLCKPRDFCVDGELRTMEGVLRFSSTRPTYPIKILQCPALRRRSNPSYCHTNT